jgi:hypothetical protein
LALARPNVWDGRRAHCVCFDGAKSPQIFGLNNYVKTKKPPLNERHRKLRFEFCLRHKDWTVDDWRKVIFSDECNVEAGPSGGSRTVWRKPEQKLSNFAILQVNRHGLILQ